MPPEDSRPTPHIIQPTDRADTNENGLACWRSPGRVCGADCMAYQSNDMVPDGPDYKAPDGDPHQWARCKVLTDGHRSAKHLTLIANITNNYVQDWQRQNQIAPPKVKGC